MKQVIFLISLFSLIRTLSADASELIINVDNRSSVNLHGGWHYIVDPYENGYYNYRFEPREEGYFKNASPQNKSELLEYSFDTDQLLHVPGDWNSQKEKLFYYEGTLWYKKSFDYKIKPNKRLFLYFGAVNYQAHVYLNGHLLGAHTGGFTPFNFEITDHIRDGDNFIVLKVDNKRHREAVPTVNTDWYNYGGITRRVLLIETPDTYIRDYMIQLKKGSMNEVAGWVQVNGPNKKQKIKVTIPELNVSHAFETNEQGLAKVSFLQPLDLWSPENPKLYDIIIESETDVMHDRIGFRSITVKGTDILLNSIPVYLRGICIHEEAPFMDGARAFGREHAATLLGWAKALGCNFVRLAHYPHNEFMTRTADEMGLLVWSEVPVYWTIQWGNETTLANAMNQLTEMITRDKNKASVILWSMANETPVIAPRLKFLKKMVHHARQLDNTRLITAANERHYTDETTQLIDDPFGEYLDVLGCNEYIGWYDGLPDKCKTITWKSTLNKPVIISEFGGGALYGHHGDRLTRWTEEFQADVYRQNIAMLKDVPFIKGMTPWILKDFRSPRRPLPRIQDFWNRKGLITDKGEKKQAFYILKAYYDSLNAGQ